MESSLLDFLYHDPQRIGSFLSQFEDGGLLQSYRRTHSSGENEGSTISGSVGASAILKGELQSADQSATSTSEGSEKTYDPLWHNARRFLDYLKENSLIATSLADARLGRFVLARGRLQIIDIGMVRGAYELDTFKALVRAGEADPLLGANRQQRRASGQPKPSKREPTTVDFAFEMLGILPHTIQAVVAGADGAVWSTLRPDCMVIGSTDLVLKHSLDIPGEWSMLGILDALPETSMPQAPSDVLPVIAERGFGVGLLSLFAPIARQFLGRQAAHFGMTPLLIYREVEPTK